MQVRQYQEKVWNKNAERLVQYKVIAVCSLFILQPIKAIQLVKHPVCAVLLEGACFFHLTCGLGKFLLFWLYVWILISFFSYLAKFHFFHIRTNFIFFIFGRISFFSYSTYIRIFNFRQIFEGKSYPQLIYEIYSNLLWEFIAKRQAIFWFSLR